MLSAKQMEELLDPEKARVFRITHRDNFPWLLANGLHSRNSGKADPDFVNIGNEEIIERRRTWRVDYPPGGTLSDYVPFYFTPFSMMAYNINTGYRGLTRRGNEEIILLVTRLTKLSREEIPFIFSDRHATLVSARFSSSLDELDRIDWPLLRSRNFKRDNEDLEKTDRYQAEALVHKHCPVSGLLGVACYDDATAVSLKSMVQKANADLRVIVKPDWYFR